MDLPSVCRLCLERKGPNRGVDLFGQCKWLVPRKALGRKEEFGAVVAQGSAQGRTQQARASEYPGDRHARPAGRVGLVLMTYSGLPITMPMVTARYSAITPKDARMLPEKKATTIKSEVQPCTGTRP